MSGRRVQKSRRWQKRRQAKQDRQNRRQAAADKTKRVQKRRDEYTARWPSRRRRRDHLDHSLQRRRQVRRIESWLIAILIIGLSIFMARDLLPRILDAR